MTTEGQGSHYPSPEETPTGPGGALVRYCRLYSVVPTQVVKDIRETVGNPA